MAVSDISLFTALRTRMSWLQHRQGVLAENVANADTPGYLARDLDPIDPASPSGGGIVPARTHRAHLAAGPVHAGHARAVEAESFEVTPSGNSVVLEEEMMKVAETQLDYQLATGLYGRGIGLLKTALGRRA